ncbi:MAG TPA: DUF6496 domain-containing protein, partial [Terriglobales bacterium]
RSSSRSRRTSAGSRRTSRSSSGRSRSASARSRSSSSHSRSRSKSKRKYSPKAGQNVKKEMHKLKRGKLKSGSGRKVKSRKQAIAIGLSEARRSGAKVPQKKAA